MACASCIRRQVKFVEALWRVRQYRLYEIAVRRLEKMTGEPYRPERAEGRKE